ncbi:MAG: hypothetical protein H7641_02760, partial [Candidatus Heimdallarchaeota archaeon]|nr:hypothetical protein [Candidatus Heimdallarchaeota archaeon]MCK4876484.1 hypothetical protein [Candidatus Heimdallarchaeota archaeon]
NCSTVFAAGDLARDVVVRDTTAFVANSEGGLSVIDVTDPTNPSRIGFRDTPGITTNLALVDDYALLADSSNGLVVMDIANPTNPTIKATYSTGISSAINIMVQGNLAFVVDFDNGIIVVDITDPTTPSYVGSWSKTSVSDAFVYGDYLYVTDLNDGLSVVDITNPTTPILINDLSLPGITQAVFIDGFYAYLTCQSGGFQVTQIADYSISFAGSYNTPGWAADVFVSGSYAYVADRGAGLQVLDISDPSTPSLAGSYITPSDAWDVFVSGSYAYIACSSGLQILDISDPTSPSLAGSNNTLGEASGVFVSGSYAYIACSSGLQVFDISDPTSPTFASSYPTAFVTESVFVSGAYAYVTNSYMGLLVLDISDPSTPSLAGSYITPSEAGDVFVSGAYAYVTLHEDGILQVLDISDPTSPTFAGSYNPPYLVSGVFVSGNFAYLACSSGLQVLDISDPTSPTFAGSYNTPDDAWGVFVSGAYAYIADQDSGLQIVDLGENRASQFASPCVAQSDVIFSASSATITSATLDVNDSTPASTSLTYSLSANWGSNWEAVTPGVECVFSNLGDQLKWKAEFTTSDVLVTPVLRNLSVDYTTNLVAPSLDTPSDSAIMNDYTPTFTWYGINGESNYLFQLDTSTSFTTPLLNITLPSSSASYTPSSLLAIDTYYWRVAGIDSEGDRGTFSNYRTLYIIQDANPPTINHPNDISYEQGTTGNNIIWTPTDSNPYWYNITLNSILTSHDDPWTGGNIVMDIDGLPLGIHTVVCSVFDLEGLMISDTVEVEVTSTAPPSIDDVADFDYEEGDTGNSITWHPSDANPDYYSITRDGTIIDDGPWLGGDINIDIDGLVYGSYTFVCFVNDTEGQSASDTVVITVIDNVMPTLNSPSDIVYDEGDTGNNIIWIATDNNPATYILYREGVQIATNSWSSGVSIVISVDGLSAASYNYTIVVFDEAGNLVKDEVTVGVTPSAPEFYQNFLISLISILVACVLINIKKRNNKKN